LLADTSKKYSQINKRQEQQMSDFWGYAGADALAFIVIGGASIICLICARIFVNTTGE
jgi:hypothetical protein